MSFMRLSILKKILGVGLCICMVLPLIPAESNAETVSEWDGVSRNTSWFTGSSTTYYINSAAELAGLAYLTNNGISFRSCDIYLCKDINLNNYAWTPIGYNETSEMENRFMGSFFGQSHTINGLNVDGTLGFVYSGLFGVVYDSSIYDLTVKGVSSSIDISGGVFAQAYYSWIINCVFSGSVFDSSPGTSSLGLCGGIVGYAHGNIFQYCASFADVSGETNGTFTGQDEGGRYYSCYNVGFGGYNADNPPHRMNNVSSYSVDSENISFPESAWIMNRPLDSAYFMDDYYWTFDSNGVYITKDAQQAITQKYILNPNYSGAETQTIFGTSSLALPTPELREDYNFYLWQEGSNYYRGGDTIPNTGEHSLTATWYKDETSNVTIGSPTGGEISAYLVDSPDITYSEGAIIADVNVGKILVLSYVADDNNTLRSITVDGNDITGLQYSVTGAVTISADFITSVQTESTVASVTISSSGATTYYDTFEEASSFINNHAGLSNTADCSQAVIRLFSNVIIDGGLNELAPCSLPQKPCTIDGENGSTDYLLDAYAVYEFSYYIIPYNDITFRNLRIKGAISYSVNDKTCTFENVKFASRVLPSGYVANYDIDGGQHAVFIFRGYVSDFTSLYYGKKIIFDNASVTCKNFIESKEFEFIGNSTITYTLAQDSPFSDETRIRVNLNNTPAGYTGIGGSGTLTIKRNSTTWVPAAGHSIFEFKHNKIRPSKIDLSQISLDLGDGILWRFREMNIYYSTYYNLYNPSISLKSNKNSTVAPNTAVTLSATPSIGSNAFPSPVAYTWYSCDSDGSNPKLLLEDSAATYTPSTARGGTKYYYCTSVGYGSLEVKSNIVSVSVSGPTYIINTDTLGSQARLDTWDALRFGASFSLAEIKSNAEAGDFISYGFNVALKENVSEGQLLGKDVEGVRFYGSADGTELYFAWLEEYETYTAKQLAVALRQIGFKVFSYDDQSITFALIMENMSGDRIYSDVVFRSFLQINGIDCFGVQKFNSIDNIKTAYSNGTGGESTLYPSEQ